jgi:hypothetical protein
LIFGIVIAGLLVVLDTLNDRGILCQGVGGLPARSLKIGF